MVERTAGCRHLPGATVQSEWPLSGMAAGSDGRPWEEFTSHASRLGALCVVFVVIYTCPTPFSLVFCMRWGPSEFVCGAANTQSI